MKYLLTCCCIVVISFASDVAWSQTDGDTYLESLLNTSLIIDTTGVKVQPEASITVSEREEAWKQWQVVQNYYYGKDRGNLPMIADLSSLHPYFRDKIAELITICKAQGIELAIVESYRTHAKQAEYFGMGKKYTRSKGGKSKHQYGLAVDLVPFVDGKPEWDNQALWKKVGSIGERLGLRWGGRWRSPYDPAHFEWSGGMTATELAQGKLPALPESILSLYPCLDEELAALQKYWEAWEAEQSVLASTASPATNDAAGSAGQKP